jgi:hypothetical protein
MVNQSNAGCRPHNTAWFGRGIAVTLKQISIMELANGTRIAPTEYSIKALAAGSPTHTAFLKEKIQEFEKEAGGRAFYYSTFRNDGYQKKMASLALSDQEQTHLYVTAPEGELAEAVQWVIENNPHLEFTEFWNSGYNEEDYVYSQKTAVLNFKIRH